MEEQHSPVTPFWYIAGVLYRWRRMIVAITGVATIVAIVVSLLLPKWYYASASVIAPESSGPNLSALLGDISSAAAALLGGGPSGDYVRYMAILNSRTMLEELIHRYNLIQDYGLEDSETPLEDALERLREKDLVMEIDDKYEFMRIGIYARTPEKAAEMANYLTEALNKRYAQLQTENAHRYRVYVEQRYHETRQALDSLREALQHFQEQYGVIELPSQTEAFLTHLATLKAEQARAEIEATALRLQYGPDNPQVQAARALVEAAQRKVEAFLQGQDVLLPVPLRQLPALGRRYAELMQDVLMYGEILKVVRPMLEQALFQEKQEHVAIQVLDPAVPPVKKARPKRMIIVFLTMLSALLLALFFALLLETWKRQSSYIQARLQAFVEKKPPSP